MTNRAMRLKNKEGRLWIRYLASKSRYDKNNHIKCKNDLRELTRKLRRDYEQELARIAKSKPKAFWKYAKSRLKTKPQIPALSKPDGSKASTVDSRYLELSGDRAKSSRLREFEISNLLKN